MVPIFLPGIFWCGCYYSHFYWIISLSGLSVFPPASPFLGFPHSKLLLLHFFHSLPTSPHILTQPSPPPASSHYLQAPLSHSEGCPRLLWPGRGWQRLISCLSINHVLLSTQSSSDPSASLAASSGSLIHARSQSTDKSWHLCIVHINLL